jgi:hypothetical protein
MPGKKAPAKPQARLPDYPFIISNEATNTNPETRKSIRRHVMLGKNRGRYLKSRHTAFQDSSSIIPRSVGTYLAFTPLPELIDPHAAVEAIRGKWTPLAPVSPYSICLFDSKDVTSALKARFFLGTCLIFNAPDSTLLEKHSHDATFFQSFIWMTQAFREFSRGDEVSFPDKRPLLKTLRLLREKLSRENERIHVSNETIFVVVNLAAHARLAGEEQSAMHHIEGISKMVDLRGGIGEITHTKLIVDILR